MKIEYVTTLRPDRHANGDSRLLEENESPVSLADGGQAMIAEISAECHDGMFVRLQSWDTSKRHLELNSLINKRIRVTVEILDGEP